MTEDQLIGFVAFSGEEEDVALAGDADGVAECFGAVGDANVGTAAFRELGGDVVDDLFGVLGVGVVRGQDAEVGERCADGAQLGAASLGAAADGWMIKSSTLAELLTPVKEVITCRKLTEGTLLAASR